MWNRVFYFTYKTIFHIIYTHNCIYMLWYVQFHLCNHRVEYFILLKSFRTKLATKMYIVICHLDEMEPHSKTINVHAFACYSNLIGFMIKSLCKCFTNRYNFCSFKTKMKKKKQKNFADLDLRVVKSHRKNGLNNRDWTKANKRTKQKIGWKISRYLLHQKLKTRNQLKC